VANKRIFVAFAIEDEGTKNLFTGQAKNAKVPYEFVDMSIKTPYDEKWKTNCRSRIKGCDGVIALISKDTKKSEGELWEINCTKDEKIPLTGIYINGGGYFDKPDSMFWITCKEWTWENVKDFIESL